MSVNNRKRSNPNQNSSSPEKKPRLAKYLDDYTPIRTIEVANLPSHLKDEDVKLYVNGYFERDGPVDHVELVAKSESEKVAYVTFVLPDDAAQLLSQQNVPGYSRKSVFTYKEAPDAYQPKIDPNALNLAQINDHCLLDIMSKLMLMDVISLGKTCTRMQQLSRLYFKKFTHFTFGSSINGAISVDTSVNEANLPTILEEIGEHIISIDWTSLGAPQFQLLARHCPNVRKITLVSLSKHVNTVILNRHKAFFANVTKLSISSTNHLVDGGVRAMISGKQVKTLNLNGCWRVSGQFLNKDNRKNLKFFRVTDCPRIKDPSELYIPAWKQKLIKFVYDKCCSLNCLRFPANSLNQLKELHLDFSCFKGDISGFNFDGLKKIKELTLTRNNVLQTINCNDLIHTISKIDTLESFTIHLIQIDNNTIEYFGWMKRLKKLSLQRIDNKIGRNLYQCGKFSHLQELSITFSSAEEATGKLIVDMIATMPKMTYFSHSSITWEILDLIRSAKFFDGKSSLKIGVPGVVFHDQKKIGFDQAVKGRIVLSVQD